MIALNLRYVTERKNKRGKVRFYWQRLGFPLTRLPNDPLSAEFINLANDLNRQADAKVVIKKSASPPTVAAGTLTYLINHYRKSPDFTKNLKPRTKRTYGQLLNELDNKFGDLPIKTISRKFIFAYRDSLAATPNKANSMLRMLRIILNYALDREWITTNPAQRPKQLKIRPRKVIWTPDIRQRFIDHATPEMLTPFYLGFYTVQRLEDCLLMTWSQYDGARIILGQEKTEELVYVPVHSTLKSHLDKLPKVSTHILVNPKDKPYSYNSFQKQWKAVRAAAGLEDYQFRDLRRTGMVEMSLAGANTQMVAAVSGHAINTTQNILDTYIPRYEELAKEGMRLWQNASGTKV
jgi:integrase